MGARRRLDVRALHTALFVIREHRGLSWRAVAEETGLSPSLFTRLSDGKRPDVDSLCTLIAWLKVPLDRFVIVPSDQGEMDIARYPRSAGEIDA